MIEPSIATCRTLAIAISSMDRILSTAPPARAAAPTPKRFSASAPAPARGASAERRLRRRAVAQRGVSRLELAVLLGEAYGSSIIAAGVWKCRCRLAGATVVKTVSESLRWPAHKVSTAKRGGAEEKFVSVWRHSTGSRAVALSLSDSGPSLPPDEDADASFFCESGGKDTTFCRVVVVCSPWNLLAVGSPRHGIGDAQGEHREEGIVKEGGL